MFNNFFFENYTLFKIMSKNMVRVGQATDDDIIGRMRTAHWITTATHTHTHIHNM